MEKSAFLLPMQENFCSGLVPLDRAQPELGKAYTLASLLFHFIIDQFCFLVTLLGPRCICSILYSYLLILDSFYTLWIVPANPFAIISAWPKNDPVQGCTVHSRTFNFFWTMINHVPSYSKAMYYFIILYLRGTVLTYCTLPGTVLR